MKLSTLAILAAVAYLYMQNKANAAPGTSGNPIPLIDPLNTPSGPRYTGGTAYVGADGQIYF